MTDTMNTQEPQELKTEHLGFDTTPSQKADILAVAKRNGVGYGVVLRMCADDALERVNHKLSKLKGLI